MSQLPDHKHDVGEGWHPLLDQLHEELTRIAPGYKVAQVKEKFGLLRVYIDGTPIQVDATGPDGSHLRFSVNDTATGDNWRDIQAFVNTYEGMSASICEYCGNPGRLDRSRYWLKTLCDSCVAVRKTQFR